MYISKETSGETRKRLLKVLSLAEFSVLDGSYSFEEFTVSALSRKIRSDALALVRDESMLSQLVPSDNNSMERFKVFCFHFPNGLDNSGFVGWLATHLKETLGTSVFVICGQNSDRGGIFDYWACPLNLGDEVAGTIEKLVTLSASSQDNNAGKYERSIDVFFYGLFMDVELLRSQSVMPLNPRRAFVQGFNLQIGRRATLIPTEGARAYGMLIALTHGEIVHLYSGPGLQHYQPEAVLAHTMEGQVFPALCYNLAEPPNSSERNPVYAAQLKAVLQSLGFPLEYIASIQ